MQLNVEKGLIGAAVLGALVYGTDGEAVQGVHELREECRDRNRQPGWC